jgi:hypothetical protein
MTRSATGSFRLDEGAAIFFNARRLRMIQTGSTIRGRLGRYGIVEGTIESKQLRATWHETDRRGWLTLKFDPEFTHFEGEYGVGEWPSPAAGRCAGNVTPQQR